MDDLNAQFNKLSIGCLQDRHREVFTRAIANVLSRPIAEVTYAQIIDGLPLSSVVKDVYESVAYPGHPLLDEHIELCPGVLERARQLRSNFDASVLQVDSKLFHDYQAASPGSRAFHTRLIELVAVSIHQIAVHLFKEDSSLHKDDHLGTWQPPERLKAFYDDGVLPPTLFWHPWYHDYDQYPEGVADGAGYWAEARIIGGVVLFDRRKPESAPDVDSNAIYLHADRRDVTYRIFRILDDQKQQLLQFLLSETTPPPVCPLPIRGDLKNRQRIDPEEPIETTGIYRDKWERRPPSEDDGDMRLRDVVDLFNYVSRNDWKEAKVRAMEHRWSLTDSYQSEDKP